MISSSSSPRLRPTIRQSMEDVPKQALETVEAGAIGEPQNNEEVHQVGLFSGVLSFAQTCTINLVLPFVNGLMLGFGELLAHEIAWRKNFFHRTNAGYRIYPERRKLQAPKTEFL